MKAVMPSHVLLSTRPSSVPENLRHSLGEALPVLPLFRELFLSGGGDRIEARPAAFIGQPPIRLYQAFLLHSVKRRVKRPLLHAQKIGGHMLDMVRQRIPVNGAFRFKCTQHEKGKSALQDIVP